MDCLKSHMFKLEELNYDESIKSDLIRTFQYDYNSIKALHEFNLIQ